MLKVSKYVLLVLPLALLVSWGPSHVRSYSRDDIYRLYDFLFEEGGGSTRYKPQVRPSEDGEPTHVYIDVYLLAISDLDERAQELEVSLILELYWNDAYLTWDPSEYGEIIQLLVPQETIWLPDVVIENSVERQRQLGYDENKVIIDEDGDVTWRPSIIAKTDCDIDVTFYPFDTQTCSVIISTWMSDKSEIDIEPDVSTKGMLLNRYSESGTWELVENKIELLPDLNDLTRIQFNLTLKRLRTYYVLNIILPVLFLSFTASMVFFLPADAGEKVGMSITILLAYAVYLTIIADDMPQTSLQVPYISVYLIFLLGVTALGVILAVVVLHLHHKPEEREIAPCMKAATRAIRRALCIRRKPVAANKREGESIEGEDSHVNEILLKERSKPDDSEIASSNIEEITWPKVAETMDRVLFVILSLFIALSTTIFILILILHAD